MRTLWMLVILSACSAPPVTATVQLESADGVRTTVNATADTFHLHGFVDVRDDDGSSVTTQFAQFQPGRYSTELDVGWASGTASVDADVKWRGSGRFPFETELSFADGELWQGTTPHQIVGGGLSVRNQGCKSAGGLGASSECGQGWAWDDDASAEIGFTMSTPFSSANFTADLCPDELVERWLDPDQVTMTGSKLNLGNRSIDCVTTQAEARVCGTDARGVDADGCGDWRVVVAAWPNATQANAELTVIFAGGADCGDTFRTCRSHFSGGSPTEL